jgi:hypothetical protein
MHPKRKLHSISYNIHYVNQTLWRDVEKPHGPWESPDPPLLAVSRPPHTFRQRRTRIDPHATAAAHVNRHARMESIPCLIQADAAQRLRERVDAPPRTRKSPADCARFHGFEGSERENGPGSRFCPLRRPGGLPGWRSCVLRDLWRPFFTLFFGFPASGPDRQTGAPAPQVCHCGAAKTADCSASGHDVAAGSRRANDHQATESRFLSRAPGFVVAGESWGALLRNDNPGRAEGGACLVADAQVHGTPHAVRPPSPRRRTLCGCCGEFIRSRRRDAEDMT